MAKALRKVAMVAAIVATVATIAAAPWVGLPVAVAQAAATAATVATVVALTASIGAALLQKKPPAQGNSTQIQIGANMPMPYTMGRTYVGGNMVHDVGYGGTIDDVPNPYSSTVLVWSGAGPVEAIEAFQGDFTTISFSGGEATGYYDNFMWLDTQLGATPEASALAGPHGAIPQWGAAYKLSGYAAGLVTMKFDKKAKRYASGVPQFGAIIQGVMAYDPRLDTARPGGAGTHAFDDETSFEYSQSPALHGVTYARGRYQNGKKVVGCGFGEDQIDWPAWMEFANVCDANGWVVGGTIYEGASISRWDNLKRICAAGGASPCFVGGLLSVRYSAPKTALFTITADDLADGDYSVPGMKSWRERKNGIIPRYRSESHRWEYVQSELVTVEEYVTEDGEEKNEEVQYDLVQDKDQAAQLAAYELVDGREFGLITLSCKPWLIAYRPGEAGNVDIPELGLNDQLCVIHARTVDPATGIVTLSLMSETTAKHAFALGQSGTAPPTPTLTTGEDMDEVLATTSRPHVEVVASEAEQLALDAAEGDVVVRTDLSTTFIHNGGDTGTMADWTEALSPPPIDDAADINFTPAGNIAATDVQAAIVELDTEKLASSSYTAADVLTKLLTVDGSGSGLDADLLDGQSGAYYLDRANHTGTITAAVVSDFGEAAQDAIGAMVDASLVYVDATPLLQRAALTGDVTASAGSNALTIANDAVTNPKLANMAQATFKGRQNAAGTGDPEDLTPAQATTILSASRNTWTNGQDFATYLKLTNAGTSAGAGTEVHISTLSGGIFINTPTSNIGYLAVANSAILSWDTNGVDLASGKVMKVNGTQVVTSRRTGWGAPTGTPTRTTFATGSVTLPQLAERVKALIDDLTTHGLIGA